MLLFVVCGSLCVVCFVLFVGVVRCVLLAVCVLGLCLVGGAV